ncbi:hypothetical protein [Ligaoa zhengdingensis]|uniref:hypothetical protein n=1 Tax=Ligaoa zhengdingensis TaxID=2763658 RepID=UPI0031BA22F5
MLRGGPLETGKKRGPKTDNPKLYKIGVKLDLKSKQTLDAYCEQKAVSVAEAVRRGISKLEPDLNQK